MKKADIKTGFLCNNNCLFCVQGPEKKKFGNKNTKELIEIIKKAKRGCDTIVFTGGEPTIRRDLIELVALAKKLKFKTIQIQSNGRMFVYENFCKDIVDAGANEFALALHGHNAELHNYLTGAESFRQIVSGIKTLKKMKQKVITNTVVTKSNYRHLPEIVKVLIGLDVDQIQFAFVHAVGAAGNNFDSVVPRMEMVAPYLKEAIDIGKMLGKKVMTEGIPFCLLVGYEKSISEVVMPDIKIFDQISVIDNYKKMRINSDKAKGPECSNCIYNNICEGPWKEYPREFGWDEFKPVIKKKKDV
ncbi:MAG: radical SAM protein [Candidatus Moranbacteria bacterium]|nr:radical SAM protein [Candidatus Moranbacteria bacterium]